MVVVDRRGLVLIATVRGDDRLLHEEPQGHRLHFTKEMPMLSPAATADFTASSLQRPPFGDLGVSGLGPAMSGTCSLR